MHRDDYAGEAGPSDEAKDHRDLHGEAPPCRVCEARAADHRLDDRLCQQCAPTISCALCTFLVDAAVVVDLDGTVTAVCRSHAAAIERGDW